MTKILCKKDWYLDGELGYKEGKYYKVLNKNESVIIRNDKPINRIYLQADNGFKGWFWSGSDYFDVDSLFE